MLLVFCCVAHVYFLITAQQKPAAIGEKLNPVVYERYQKRT